MRQGMTNHFQIKQEGITVPPEYGSIEIEQVKTKEGEEPKFIAKAFYSEKVMAL